MGLKSHESIRVYGDLGGKAKVMHTTKWKRAHAVRHLPTKNRREEQRKKKTSADFGQMFDQTEPNYYGQ